MNKWIIEESKTEDVYNFSENIKNKFLSTGLVLSVPNQDMLSSYFLDKKGNAIQITVATPHKLGKRGTHYCYVYKKDKSKIDVNYPWNNFGDDDLIDLYNHTFDNVDVFEEIEDDVDYAIKFIEKLGLSSQVVDSPSKLFKTIVI